METLTPKIYHQAPLPFVGQKRTFIKHFRQVLLNNIINDGDGWTIVDVFGGSGLLAHNTKRLLPKAQVIYNDFDGYAHRLQCIDDTNRLRQLIYDATKHLPRQSKLPHDVRDKVKKIIRTFDGAIDVQSISPWLLFSGRQVATLDEFLMENTFYNTVRKSDYPMADGYLDGLQIVGASFDELIPMFANQDKTLLILDPPYLCTMQKAYNKPNYFSLVDFLTMMTLITPPFIIFSSTKSELPAYLEYVKKHLPKDWNRLGKFDKVVINTHMNGVAGYEDNMIYRF